MEPPQIVGSVFRTRTIGTAILATMIPRKQMTLMVMTMQTIMTMDVAPAHTAAPVLFVCLSRTTGVG
jgi:hypothetical protein